MNTKHTPGPWRQSTANPNAVNKDGEKCAIGIATAHGTDDSNYAAFFPSTDEARANARLIAAAPELLEACIEALSLFDNYPACWEAIGTYEVLNNAIAKAKATL